MLTKQGCPVPNVRAHDAQTRAAVRHLRKSDPVMAGLIERVGPCRAKLQRGGTTFSALAEAIFYQQVTGRVAAILWKRLCDRVGRRYPRPADVLALSVEELRACGLSRQKTGYIRDLAERVADGRLPRRLASLDDEEVAEALVQVKGIGQWTADMFLMFRLGRPDVLPVGDYGIRKAMQEAYRMRDLPKPERMLRVAAPWRPHRSVACWYLWRSIGGAAGADELV